MQIKLDKVKFLVVDEADRMLDLGFSDDLADINQLTSQRQQTMMFSATFAPRIQQLAMRVMHDGGSSVQKIQIDSPQEKHSNIKQVLFWADNAQHKRKLLDHWLRDASINQAIVFASTQIECDGLAADLQQDGFSAVALHGALPMVARIPVRKLRFVADGGGIEEDFGPAEAEAAPKAVAADDDQLSGALGVAPTESAASSAQPIIPASGTGPVAPKASTHSGHSHRRFGTRSRMGLRHRWW
jgi:hypothetical protein